MRATSGVEFDMKENLEFKFTGELISPIKLINNEYDFQMHKHYKTEAHVLREDGHIFTKVGEYKCVKCKLEMNSYKINKLTCEESTALNLI